MPNPGEIPIPEVPSDYGLVFLRRAREVRSGEGHDEFLQETFRQFMVPKLESTFELMGAYMDLGKRGSMRQQRATLGDFTYNGYSFADNERNNPLETQDVNPALNPLYFFALLLGENGPEKSMVVIYKRTVPDTDAVTLQDAPYVSLNIAFLFDKSNPSAFRSNKNIGWSNHLAPGGTEVPDVVNSEFINFGSTDGEELECMYLLLERAEAAIRFRTDQAIDKDR